MKRLNTLVLGGCLVNRPMDATARANEVLDYRRYGPLQLLHSFTQMFQRIQFIRGEREFPDEIRRLCRFPRDLGPLPEVADFRDLDVAIVEPTTPVDLMFRGFSLNRQAVQRFVGAAAGEGNKAVAALLTRWFRKGLIGFDEEARADAASKLLKLISGSRARDKIARELLEETRSVKCDQLGGLQGLHDILRCPMGLVLYNFRYMPDGRAISWPAGFREDTIAAAKSLDLAVYDPTSLVVGYGADAALVPGGGHYTEAFKPIMGEALLEFIQAVHAQRSGLVSFEPAPAAAD